MKKTLNRMLALALLLILLTGILPLPADASPAEPPQPDRSDPAYVFTDEDNALLEQDVFAEIEQIEAEAESLRGKPVPMTEQHYIQLIPRVVEAVERSETYVPGTLRQNGYFLSWETTVGIPCCYDPRMEAKLHNAEGEPDAARLAKAEAEAKALLHDRAAAESGTSSMKIGLIQPYWESASNYADYSFNSYSPHYLAMWQSLCEAVGGEGMRYSMNDATVDNIARVMSECDMVLFDSHGTTDYVGENGDFTSQANCSYLCLTNSLGVTEADTAPQQGPYGTFYHCMKGADYAFVSGTCIANHMSDYAPHSFLYMGICLGMATDGMEAGLRAKGVEAVYGYSQSVTFAGDIAYMEAVNGAIRDGSSLSAALAAAKESLGPWDGYDSQPSLEGAIADFCAFPIVVSSEDAYPGQGSVDGLQNVNATWSLSGTDYSISAVSNNEAWGTVAVRGAVLVPTPAEGYYAAGCTVLRGSATVSWNGSVFFVHAYSDCTVQVNFAAKTPATVTFLADGSVLDAVSGYVGDPICLPAAPDVEDWCFQGWVREPIGETRERPAFFRPGHAFAPQADTTLYALYLRVESESGYESVYELLSEAPESWEGSYVISYGTDERMYLLTAVQETSDGMSVESAENATAFSDTGITLEEAQLYDVPDACVFTMAAHGEYDSLQSVSTGDYYGMDQFHMAAYKAYLPEACDWTLGVGANASCLRSASNVEYPYLSFLPADRCFWGYNAVDSSIRFWKGKELGLRSYCTNPTSVHPNPFEDVSPGKYYYDAVQWAYYHSPRVTSGTDATHFSPGAACTREQAVVFLWAAAGKPAPKATETAFTDVKQKAYYYDAVLWAQENGITNGVSETAFGVKEYCTRAQIAVFLWRWFGSVEPAGKNSFQDVPSHAYYSSAVDWAVENGITNGTSPTTFSPKKYCTRAEIVTFLYAAETNVKR